MDGWKARTREVLHHQEQLGIGLKGIVQVDNERMPGQLAVVNGSTGTRAPFRQPADAPLAQHRACNAITYGNHDVALGHGVLDQLALDDLCLVELLHCADLAFCPVARPAANLPDLAEGALASQAEDLKVVVARVRQLALLVKVLET